MSPINIAVLVFLTLVLFSLGIMQLKTGAQEAAAERLHQLFGKGRHGWFKKYKNQSNKSNIQIGRRILFLAGRIFTARKITEKVDVELARADIPLKGEEYLGLMLILSLTGGLILTVITGKLVAGILAAVLGCYLPYFILKTAKIKRLSKFNDQIGDALVIMANSLRSGFSFLQSLDMVCKEMPAPLAREFGITLQEMNLGTSTEEALSNMSFRVQSEDLELVVTAVLIQRQVGGNLSEVLDGIASTIRERVRIKGEINTLTAQGKISGLIIGLLPILITAVLYVINPAYIKLLFTCKTGLAMVFAAVLSQIMGLAIIRKIVQIPV